MVPRVNFMDNHTRWQKGDLGFKGYIGIGQKTKCGRAL